MFELKIEKGTSGGFTYGCLGNHVARADIAGFVKVADAMLDQALCKKLTHRL